MRRPLIALFALAVGVIIPACGESQSAPFTMQIGPQFVNGAVPGAMTSLLVTVQDEQMSDDPVTISASVTGATVMVHPEAISPGQVAEVQVVAEPISTGDAMISVVVTATRGEVTETATRDLTVYDWEDDRGPYARELLAMFTDWLAENRPDLGITQETVFEGAMVAPALLVVSHYCFMTEDWEIGLSWHVMIPPDDWAEIYLRPRGELTPTAAFRLASQNAAIEDGVVQITEVPAPDEVTR